MKRVKPALALHIIQPGGAMRLAVFSIVGSAFVVATGFAVGQAPAHKRLNPVIALLEQNKPVFGVYAPSNGGGRRGPEMPARPASELAKDALGYPTADFLFNGSMEGGVDRALPAYVDFVKAMDEIAG